MIGEFITFRGVSWSHVIVAWGGAVVFVGHSVFQSWVKFALNRWYGRFYDAMQWMPLQWSDGSGEPGSGSDTDLARHRAVVWQLLLEFGGIVAPVVVVQPIAQWISNRWCLAWRLTLVRTYVAHCKADTSIEGVAQRIHEDTRRFSDGVYRSVRVLLDAFLSLSLFVPILLTVGAEVHIPGWKWPPWLLTLAMGASITGLGISMFIGRHLVGLEVDNQRVEARLRTRLVELEQGRCVSASRIDVEMDVVALRVNYGRLYANFALFDAWIGFYDQAMLIIPYLLIAPLLFADDPDDRVTLGALMRVTNAFGVVFGALSTVTANWAAVNDFRSTVRRLSEFENHVYCRKMSGAQLVPDEPESDRLPATGSASQEELRI